MSLLHQLEQACRIHASRPALTSPGATPETLTYAQLWDATRRQGQRLLAAGLTRGELACFLMRRGPELVTAMLGALWAGGAFCAINDKARWPQVRHAQRLARARVTWVDGPCLSHLDATTSSADDGPPLVVSGPLGALAQQRVGELGARGLVDRPRGEPDPGRTPPPWRVIDDDPGCCLMTSGSSGTPKGVLISRGDLLRRAQQEVSDFGLQADDRLLGLLPFSFDVGLNQLLSGLLAGAEVVLLQSWLPADVAAAVQRHRITGVSAVPEIWRQVLRAGESLAAPLGGLRYLTVSGGALEVDALAALRALLPTTGVFKTYGQTELFRATMLRPEDCVPERWHTVGRAVTDCEVLVVSEDGRPVPSGQPGEVIHRGVGTMLGYLGEPAATERKLRARAGAQGQAERWVYTGDIGVLDADGYLTLLGREDMMIKCSGYRVYPAEVEAPLRESPDVLEAAVFGVDDPATGQRIVAAVVPRTEDPALRARLEQHLRARLPSYMVPQELALRGTLPKTASGKIEYGALRDAYLRERGGVV